MDVNKIMLASSRIPPDPIPEPAEGKKLLIAQILDFQQRYKFSGVRHTEESLQKRSVRYLERLCDMQLIGIATSRVIDRNRHT
jgi:hypothetical protein